MASKVTPSTPGAPSFCLAISYAARSVSVLQTWTYRPQKRQDGSAFALTYILRLRSCKPIDAFVISSLPSPWLEVLQMAGPLRSADITPPHRYYRPGRHPLVFGRLPGGAGYNGLPCSGDFSPGRGGLLQLLSMSLSPVPSLPPRRGEQPYQSVFGCSCCLRPPVAGSTLGVTHFRGHNAFTVITAR